MGVSQRVRQHRFGRVEGKIRAELRVRGLLFLSVLSLAACRVPPTESGEAGPALLEVLGLEIDNDELLARNLRRRRALLTRQIRAIHLETRSLEEQRMKAMVQRLGPRKALATALSELRFLETSLAESEQRGRVVAEQLRKIDADEKRLAVLRKRGAALPELIKSLMESQLALEKQVAELSKKKAAEQAKLARLKGNVKVPPKLPASKTKKPAAKRAAGKKATGKDQDSSVAPKDPGAASRLKRR